MEVQGGTDSVASRHGRVGVHVLPPSRYPPSICPGARPFRTPRSPARRRSSVQLLVLHRRYVHLFVHVMSCACACVSRPHGSKRWSGAVHWTRCGVRVVANEQSVSSPFLSACRAARSDLKNPLDRTRGGLGWCKREATPIKRNLLTPRVAHMVTAEEADWFAACARSVRVRPS